MELFGVGPLEFLLVLVLALVILGPQDMVGTARKIGQWIYRVVRSPTWRAIINTTQDLRELPQKIVREAGLEEAMQEVKDTADQVKSELNATTSEISSEMRAAGNAVSSEMGTAFETVKSDATEPAPLPIAYTGNVTWPENILAKHDPEEPPSVAEIIRTSSRPYETQLGFFAEALQIGSKPEIDLGNLTVPVAPPPPPLYAPEFFSTALGAFSDTSSTTAQRAEYEFGPVMVDTVDHTESRVLDGGEPSPTEKPVSEDVVTSSENEGIPVTSEEFLDKEQSLPDWAKGVPTGLSPTDGITAALEERMQQMEHAQKLLEIKQKQEENPNGADSPS